MTYQETVRNSRILGIFDEILHSSKCNLRAVEIAGRGIAAEARCTLTVLSDKGKRYVDSQETAIRRTIAFSDRLLELGAIEDDLDEVWRVRLSEQSDDAAFEQALNKVVLRLEAWPQGLDREDEG